jgi:hypothetical protein
MSTQYQTPQVPSESAAVEPHLNPVQVAQTLAELISMGFVKTVKDGFGITRYKLVRQPAHKLETHDDFVS